MMRVLLFNYEFPPLGGGAANATLQILTEFGRSHDIVVDVITSSIGKGHVEKLSDNITVHYVNIHKTGSLHRQTNMDLLLYSIQAYLLARKMTRKHDYDGIHAFFGIPCGYIASKLGIPYIVSLRGSDVPFYNRKYLWLDRFFFARMSKRIWHTAAAVTATSEGLKELALKIAPTQTIQVIRNGVHKNEFTPGIKSDGLFTIISTSRLVERKGIVYLLDAFILFAQKHANARLLIAGEGELLDVLRAKARMSTVSGQIIFLGVVPHCDMIKYYHDSDIFVLPSMNEGMSNSLLEAMSSGLAVVATDTGDAKYLIAGGGRIIPKKDSKSIFEFFEHAYAHPEELAEMKRKNIQATAVMGWTEVARQTALLYESVFTQKKS